LSGDRSPGERLFALGELQTQGREVVEDCLH
jgi:hypothetical protein